MNEKLNNVNSCHCPLQFNLAFSVLWPGQGVQIFSFSCFQGKT